MAIFIGITLSITSSLIIIIILSINIQTATGSHLERHVLVQQQHGEALAIASFRPPHYMSRAVAALCCCFPIGLLAVIASLSVRIL